jgi:hypothetical protein
MTKLEWPRAIVYELNQARSARSEGKEGMARVCARRAAGIAIAEYLRKHKLPDPGPSAMDRLNFLKIQESISPMALNAARHLTQRVDENFQLPPNVDLIREAQLLINTLLPEYQSAEDQFYAEANAQTGS